METPGKDPDFVLSDSEKPKLNRLTSSSKKIKKKTKKRKKKSTKKKKSKPSKKKRAKNPELENLKKYWLPG